MTECLYKELNSLFFMFTEINHQLVRMLTLCLVPVSISILAHV